MGCDIHTMAELKMERSYDFHEKAVEQHVYKYDGWWPVPAVFDNPYHKVEEYVMDVGNDFYAPFTIHPFMERNYALFALLADVRNTSSDDPDWIKPIDNPRGNPDEMSDEAANYMYSYGVDGHSHTWFTLDELIDFDFDGVALPKEFDDSKWKPFETIKKDVARLKYICDRAEIPYSNARFIMFFDN